MFLLYTKLFQQCVALNFFVPRSQPLTSDLEICNHLWTLEQELYRKDYSFNHPFDIFFNFSFFFVPSLKRRLILLFVPVFLLCIICLFQCSAVIILVRFFVVSFFCIPTDSSFRLRSIVPIVRCLGGGYCGNTVNSVFRNYIFFLATLFFL